MRTRLVFLLLGCVGVGFGQYTWDYTRNPVASDTTRWSTNGSPSYGSYGVNFSGSGGSLISIPAISGTNSNDYEETSTLAINGGGGTYIHFLRTSGGTVQAGSGSYVSVELVIPSGFTSPGTATLNINKCAAGTVTGLGSTSITATNGMTLRTIIFGGNLWVFTTNNLQVWAGSVPTIAGNPGVGGYGMPAGSGFHSVELGHHDTVAPSQVILTSVATSVFPTSASLKWQGVLDDANGIGLYEYYVSRNGTAIGTSPQAEFTDATAAASTTYMYTIQATDFHGNSSSGTTVTVTTPPASAIDPRRTGVYATGSYWGGGGEQIDTLSGNMNFSLPVFTAVGRNGSNVPVGLVYNSQNWRQDGGVNWNLGHDVGFGYGWQMLIGSITPYYTSYYSGVDHYVYTDSTGAQYLLTVNNSGVWSSTNGVYVWFDSNAHKLHFRDGSFWVMGCTSGGTEADAGTMYPTILEDVSGNQITVKYYAGVGLPSTATNTSSRIYLVYDPRTTGPTYSFYYNTDPVPHLTYAYNSLGSSESYAFTYTTAALAPPFGSDPNYAGLTTAHLSTMAQYQQTYYVTSPFSYQFGYDSAGAAELTSVIFPYGGELSWNYTSFTYSGGRIMREVGTRCLAADSLHATTWTYPITRPDAPNSVIVHSGMTLADASGIGAKTWNFTNSGSAWQLGLVSQFVQSASVGGAVLKNDTYTWSQDPAGNPYISAKSSTSDPGSSNPQSAYSTQTLDQYGNVTQSVLYPYNNTTTPIKTYVNTYLSSSTYTSNYIFNLLASTNMTPAGGSAITLVTNTYDSTANCYSAMNYTPPIQCGGLVYPATGPTNGVDPSPPIPLGQRGYLSYSVTPAKWTALAIYTYGSPAMVWGSDGQTTLASADASTNYAAPITITSQSYTQTLAYNPWLAVTQTTGANGEQMSMGYDIWGRPASATSPYGAVTGYGYSTSLPFTQTQGGPDGVTTTTLDGLGRAVLVARGDTSGVHGYTATTYAPCACSPLAKIQKTSQPYAYGSSASAWTTYTYDGLGRPLTVQQPDGASTTTYAYLGNLTTVTDPAGKWKQLTTDVSGNLVTVTEPDPANPPSGTLTTTYTYDWMNHVIGVSMARAGTTQTRSFVYDNAGRLTSATNPENGTVSYSYNSDNTLQMKTDAKGQQTVYSYDSLKRLTMTQYFPSGTTNPEDGCQRVTYSYDTNPYDSTFSQNSYGRLTAVLYGAATGPIYAPGAFCTTELFTSGLVTYFADMYSYHPAGGVTAKRLWMARGYSWNGNPGNNFSGSIKANVDVDYTYDNTGRTATTTYPMAGGQQSSLVPQGTAPVRLTYGYDSMGRPNALTDNSGYTGWGWGWPSGTPLNWAQNVQYDYAGRMSSEQFMIAPSYGYSGYTPAWTQQTMSYNVNGQLTFIGWADNPYGTGFGTPSGPQYNYSATQNNGQITQAVNGGATVSYQYDALKRLTSASSTAYTQTFQYDGFGNLTAKVLNGTSTPIPVNAANNRLSSASYDANGNMTSGSGATLAYDEANRIASAAETSGGVEYYGYSADNKRFYKYTSAGTEQLTLYGARGEKLGVYAINPPSPGATISPVSTNIWFGGKLIVESSETAHMDRLGTNLTGFTSAGYPYINITWEQFYPYGDEITSTLNDHQKFATYTRDSYTGFDYADQRYYASMYGRFNTADPSTSSAGPGDPGSWNRYSYTRGDPVNRVDPRGTCDILISGWLWNDGWSPVTNCDASLGPDFNPAAYAVCLANPQFCARAGGGAGVPADGSPYGNQNQVITNARNSVVDILENNPICAATIGEPSFAPGLAAGVAGSVPIDVGANIGSISFTPLVLQANGTSASTFIAGESGGLGRFSTASIVLSQYVDWSTGTAEACSASSCQTVSLAAGYAAQVGAASVTPTQFLEAMMLHEIEHAFGGTHNSTGVGDTEDMYNTAIWKNCFPQ